ncbi:IS66 family insertion sequence element accessory protein TnpA [Thauera butanivorans]|uniref:IS66 family insertion sequence element accessory protein TnpA n=1 Tax=Thauera butanivorans TaxID=86174 RepID=UPI003F70F280
MWFLISNKLAFSFWRASGLSQQAYCASEGLRVSAFGCWVSKANRASSVAWPEPLTLVASWAS